MPALLQNSKTIASQFDIGKAAAGSSVIAVSPSSSESTAHLITSVDATNCVDGGTGTVFRRIDASHLSAPSPMSLLSWRYDVSRCNEPVAAKEVGHALASEHERATNEEHGQAGAVRETVSRTPPQPSPAKVNLADRENLLALLAEAAHEIRSPIAVARQLLHSVRERLTSEPSHSRAAVEYIEIAAGRLEQASQWSENILARRRLADRQPISIRKRFLPSQLKQQISPVLHGLAKARNVGLEWIGWDDCLPRLYMDHDHLSRVIINLVSNAVQASRAGQNVSVRIAWQTNVVQRLVIAVEDLGPGLRSDLLEYINGKQSLLPYVTAKVNNGIGLQNAKQLTESMGGRLSAQLPASGGTTLRLSLPVDDRSSLIRSWLEQQAALQSAPPASLSQPLNSLSPQACPALQMLVVRFEGIANTTSSAIGDAIQRQATANDFVYKVSSDRWVWLAISSLGNIECTLERLSAAIDLANLQHLAEGNWLIQQTHSWPWTPGAVRSDVQDARAHFTAESNLITLSQQVSIAMEVVVGRFVQTLDSLEPSPETVVLTKARSSIRRARNRVDAAAPAPRAPKSIDPQSMIRGAISKETQPVQPVPSIANSIAIPQAKLRSMAALQAIAADWHKSQEMLNRSVIAKD